MAAHVTYVFGDLLTGQIIEEIPCSGVYITKQFGSGSMQCSFYYDTTGKDNETLRAATVPGRCYVVCEREGAPIWSGIVWSRTYQSQAKVASLYCITFEDYPSRRFIRSDFVRTNVEQQQIFLDLYTLMQSDPHSVLVTLPSAPGGTLLAKSVDVKASEYKTFRSVIDEIANTEDGFDWRIDVARADNVYTRTLSIGYPTLGAFDPKAIVFDYPGNIFNYWDAESMASSGTHVFGVGAGEGDTMIQASHVATDLLSQGFPRYDIDLPTKDITSLSTLQSIVNQQAAIRRPPMPVITAEVKGDLDPVFGSYNIGDACTLSLFSPQFGVSDQSDGLFERSTRVLGYEYYPPSDDSVELARLVFEGDDL